MDTMETRLERKLRARLGAAVDASIETVSQGLLPDFAAYRDECGFIRGVRTSLDLLDEVIKNLNRD